MPVTTPAQRALLGLIRDLFGDNSFDTHAIAAKTFDRPEYRAIIDTALCGPKWRRRGRGVAQQSHSSLRILLRYLAQEHFVTEPNSYNRWHFKEASND
jgi:hypothetical protein